jgi:pilin isopeptide linkage protein
VNVTIEALKTLTGRTLVDGEFSFALVGEGETYTAVNNAAGTISFRLTFTETGTYTYILSEVEGTLGGVTYDATEFTVTVTVTDDGNGQLAANVAVNDGLALAFANTYAAASAELTLSADKILVGRPLVDGEFSFLLTNANGEVTTVTNDAEGNIAFTLRFTEAGVYTYTMSEAAGDAAYIDYDETTYEIVVTVVDNGSGSLIVESVTVNGAAAATDALEIVFQNIYAEPPAKTGDETNVALYMGMILVSITALAVLVIDKKKQWLA